MSVAEEKSETVGGGYDDWLLERKVKPPRIDDWEDGGLGDSCCFGTRTVEIGMDCVWELHGGV
jgi:starvation-inducible outer membrane lipoprotein